jgi:hypothetical protein
MGERFNGMLFLAVLVTAIMVIFVGDANPMAVKVFTDLAAAYWAVRITENRNQGPGELKQ